MTTPDHHTRYRKAWLEYYHLTRYGRPSTDFSSDFMRDAYRLEHEMDQAQNYFTWDEFQEFKRTLPGFLDIWPDNCEGIDEAIEIEKDVDWMKEGF